MNFVFFFSLKLNLDAYNSINQTEKKNEKNN